MQLQISNSNLFHLGLKIRFRNLRPEPLTSELFEDPCSSKRHLSQFFKLLHFFPVLLETNFMTYYKCSWRVIAGWGASGGEIPALPPSTPGYPLITKMRQLRYMLDACNYLESQNYKDLQDLREEEYNTDDEFETLSNSSDSDE